MASLKLPSGASISIAAWSWGRMGAALANYLSLLDAFQAMSSAKTREQQDADLLDLLVPLVLGDAVPDEGHRKAIRTSDLGAVLEAIGSLNGVEDLMGKAVGLRLKLAAALVKATQPPPES